MKKAKSKKCNLKVLNDRVLIKPDPPDKYEGTLEIPDAYKAFYENLPDRGTIVSFGDKCKYVWVPGERVQFAKMAGAKMTFMGEDYLIVREYDINVQIRD